MLTAHGCRLLTEFSRSPTRDLLVERFLAGVPAEKIAAAHPLKPRRQAVLDCLQDGHLPEVAYGYARQLFAEYRRHCELEVRQAQLILGEFPSIKNAVLFATTPDLLVRLVAECGANFTERYATAERFCSALGTAPRSEVSGGKLLKISDTHGNARMLTALANHDKPYLMHLKGGRPLADWLANYRARARYSKTLLALCHHVTPAWWHCTKLQVAYHEYKAFGKQRPTHLTVDTVVGEVNTTTGEILDSAPFATLSDTLAAFQPQAYAEPVAAWHDRHAGD